jgi:peptide/nickel transport system permease protein
MARAHLKLIGSFLAHLRELAPFITRRIFYSIGVIAFVSVIVFTLVSISGDPLANLRENPRIARSDIARIEHNMGLDQPKYVQFGYWLRDSVRGKGEWSTSFSYRAPVLPIIWDRFKNTLVLMSVTVVVCLVIAIPLGVFSALKQYSKLDYAVTGLSFFGLSMPVFWFGLILQLVLGYYLMQALHLRQPLFYTASMYTTGMEHDFMNRARHLVLPVLTLALATVAGWSRYQRSSMLDVLNQDYLRTARAKGLPESSVIGKHALKNALIPVVTIVAIDLAYLLGGAVVTETIFAWPGMGRLFVQALEQRDFPMVMGAVIFTSIILVAFNLFADIIYGFLDPRIRQE